MTSYRTLFLDLDETLYPSSNGLWDAIGKRINNFMTQQLAIPHEFVESTRDEYLKTYGTTLNGLMVNYQIDPLDYLDYVHEVPLDDFIQPNPALQEMLAALPQKRVVFTNASHDHAVTVLRKLGIENHIDQVIDIIALEFHNKPKPEAYMQAMVLADEEDPSTCAMVDDRIDNLLPAGALGMMTVLIGDSQSHPEIDFHIRRIIELTSTVRVLLPESSVEDHHEP